MALLQQWGICPVLLRLPLPKARQVHLPALRTSPVQWAPTNLQVGVMCIRMLMTYVMLRSNPLRPECIAWLKHHCNNLYGSVIHG